MNVPSEGMETSESPQFFGQAALIITEGVIAYISANDAEALSRDLFAVPSFQYWIQDYRQDGVRQMSSPKMRRLLKDSPFKFDVVDSFSFFRQQGWTILENRIAANEAKRIGRLFPFIFPWSLAFLVMPKRVRNKYRNAAGYVMYADPCATAAMPPTITNATSASQRQTSSLRASSIW